MTGLNKTGMQPSAELTVEPVPFLDLAAQQAEVADEVWPIWRAQFDAAAFIGGSELEAFEREYADYIGVRHCVGVANGTDAIELALLATEIGPGDEVIVPVNTFIATAEAVSRVGATPVFVDVDDEHLLIDPELVERAVTQRTRAIVPVHLYGQTAPVAEINSIATADSRITVIEDGAQAQGARSSSGRAGALGAVSATSFYPGKNLGAAGDAGAVLTGDDTIAHIVRELASHGSTVKYVHERVGVNSRLDAMQAVVLRSKLRRLEGWNDARRRAAARYSELLADIPALRLPVSRPGNEDVWHLYVVRVADRGSVIAGLAQMGVQTLIHYPTPLHLTRAYEDLGHQRGDFPIAEAAADRILSLPIFPHITVEQQERVASALRRCCAS